MRLLTVLVLITGLFIGSESAHIKCYGCSTTIESEAEACKNPSPSNTDMIFYPCFACSKTELNGTINRLCATNIDMYTNYTEEMPMNTCKEHTNPHTPQDGAAHACLCNTTLCNGGDDPHKMSGALTFARGSIAALCAGLVVTLLHFGQ